MSLHVRGTVMGVRVEERINRQTGEAKKRYIVGIASPKENGYDDEVTKTEIHVSEAMEKKGIQAHYENLKGREVLAPVFISTNIGRNKDRVFVNFYFSGDGKPSVLPERKA